ncbi:MAG TPA: hypothetical protein VII15_05060 [Candidatus Cryosericum sp.]
MESINVATRPTASTLMSVDFPNLEALVSVQRMDSRLCGNDMLDDQPARCIAWTPFTSPIEPGSTL